ncbi:hypothetical protein [Acidovorax sp.]|uniref:hypothetical protein n=1 Tax=Acidovorax sp. TaxID=1872122 RepID=UPI002620E4F1|nr:hypothetical protein [Acidovorax sp.]
MSLGRWSFRSVAARHGGLALMALSMASAGAGTTGTVGPVGPVGPVGAGSSASAHRPSAAPRPTSGAQAGNRIEVTGNTVSGVRCAADGGNTASVNSVDVAGARLEGRTVIVQGHNTSDVHTRDCPKRTPQPAGTAGQTNSIRIR